MSASVYVYVCMLSVCRCKQGPARREQQNPRAGLRGSYDLMIEYLANSIRNVLKERGLFDLYTC